MKLLASVFLLLGTATAELCLPDCSSGRCIFDFNVRLTAGQLGYFEVKGCDGVNPTLGLEIGVTHTFLQSQYKNYFHPLGFAYFADGAHDDVDELEPGIPPPDSDSDCDESLSCPAPMYFSDGEYLGTYSNDPDILSPTEGEDNFGLDDYEPRFFYSFTEWLEQGDFHVNLRFDQVYDKDIFYFCHIHQFMTGRIKLLDNGVSTQPDSDLPAIPYDYDMPTAYDESCGSFGITQFQLPHPQCPLKFVCDLPLIENTPVGQFADCVESQNCNMFVGMTTGVSARSEAALFMHQMIPHHENAINMAKTLSKNGDLDCDEFDEDSADCAMFDIALSIVNGQNFQVQTMRGLLESYGFPETDDCVVAVPPHGAERDACGDGGSMDGCDKTDGAGEPGADDDGRGGGRDLGEKDGATGGAGGGGTDNICISSTGVYTVRVNLFAGELGYYTFDECGDEINPTIGMEIGATYVFDQADRSNYYHPMGFSYFADGAHAELDELEPGIPPYQSDSSCGTDLTCPAPMYLKDNEYLGTYSNIPDMRPATTGVDNFGLDDYEPLFFRPITDWAGSEFSILLKFDVEDFDHDIFYFCHIHQFMTGRIKLLKNGVPIQEANVPDIPYEYDKPGTFDQKCGTFGLDKFQLPNVECFDRFVCDVPDNDPSLAQFADCIDAMNCAMLSGMTTMASSMSQTALFIHQMVPHHQNAVNMAKALLKTGKLECDNLTEETADCALEQILREIINNQNFQIQTMYGVLELMSYPRTDDCVVNVSAGRPFEVSGDDSNDRPSGKKGSGKMSMKDKKGSDKGSGKMTRRALGHERRLFANAPRGVVRGSKS